MRVVALNRFEYAGKQISPGEEFDTTSDKDAEILELAKQVTIAKPPIETRALKAEDSEGDQPQADPKRRRYMRRDLRSEK